MELVFSKNYDIKLGPLGKLHPFDSEKYGRAMRALCQDLGDEAVAKIQHTPDGPATFEELSKVHDPEYLERLKSSIEVARALEVAVVRHIPNWLVDRQILTPMRYACAGSILAARIALSEGLCVNMSGGYHHAKPEQGEGFCIYSDIALAVQQLRDSGLLTRNQIVAYIDLDAHQGNGVSHCFLYDNSIKIFDMFNGDIYPSNDEEARKRVDFPIKLRSGCKDDAYLGALKEKLPRFLNYIGNVDFAIYNAGTDIFVEDPLGALGVSKRGVLERDLFVLRELRGRKIPTMMLPSGGYTKSSFQMIADSIREFMREEGALTSKGTP